MASAFDAFISQYLSLAAYYRDRADDSLKTAASQMEPQYAMSLDVILGLYGLIFERLAPENIASGGPELTPTPAEIQARIQQVVADFKPPRAE